MDRRRFLAVTGQAAGAAGVGLAAVSRLGARPAPGSAPPLSRFGIQLYTLRRPMGVDFEGVLLQVGEMGYEEVEFAGYFGRPPQAVSRILRRAGLDAPAAHVGFDALGDDWPRTLEAAVEIGLRWVVVPWIPAETRSGTDGYRRVAERFNRAGDEARRAGLRFAYHNHDFEFEPTPEGDLPFDILLEKTDRELVDFEMDVFWTIRGGGDPLEYFHRFPGRFPLAHLKDMDEAGNMVDVGAGTVDFGAILAASDLAGLRHAFVEHDSPEDPMATARTSLAHLRSLAR
jgi:sugar phosphate isomerase/epimerase